MTAGLKYPGRAYLGIVMLVAVATVVIDLAGLLKPVDNLIYDQLVLTAQRPAASDIVIVAIDEKSLDQLGRWPWPRGTHTELLNILNAYAPLSVGIDIIFSEPSSHTGEDAELADAIARNGRVVLPVVPIIDHSSSEIVERHPITVLEQAAARLGSVDAEIDSDGISRSLYLLSGLSIPIWPSFPLAMQSLVDPGIEDQIPGVQYVNPADRYPGEWVRDHHVLVPFSGPPGHYTRLSYSDVLAGNVLASDIDGKHVLVGLTAAGIGDRLPTPSTGHSYQMPGVEYMANVLDAIMGGRLITSLGDQKRAVIVFSLVLLAMLLYPLFSVWMSLIVWGIGMALALSIAVIFFQFQLWFPPAALLASLFIFFPVWAWSGLRSSSRLVTEIRQERSAAMDAVDHGLVILDRDMVVDHMNAQAEMIAGVTLADIVGKDIRTLLPGGDYIGEMKPPHPYIPEVLNWPDTQGHDRDIFLHINPFSDRWGGARGYVLNLALHADGIPIAGISNHYSNVELGLSDRSSISEYLLRAINDDSIDELHVFHIDIENLALIASGYLSVSPESLLSEYASRLKSSLGERHPLGRIGSDQLVYVASGTDREAAIVLAETIIQQAKQPIILDGSETVLSVNVGISQYPSDGKAPENLLKHASYAIRQNESRSRSRFKFYSRSDHEISMLDHDIEQRLRKALDQHKLTLYFQPQVSLSDGALVGFEALLRWIDDDGRQNSIDKAITIAEQSDLIHDIGQWVMKNALERLRLWIGEDIAVGRISVNLSPADIEREGFLNETLQCIQDNSIPPERLEFEITEHSVMKNTNVSTETLKSFRNNNINLSIDDFGTGYSSFDYLKNLNVDTVKIDKSFIESITEIRDDAFIVLSMISMAHGLGIDVIAEGIEKPEQAQLLAEYGCDIIQGYLVSRPIPASGVSDWVARHCSRQAEKSYLNNYKTW